MKKINLASIMPFLLILIFVVYFFLISSAGSQSDIPYSQVTTLFQEGKVSRFSVSGSGELTLLTTDQQMLRHKLADVERFRAELGSLWEEQLADGTLTDYNFEPAFEMPMWMMVLLPVLISALTIFAIFTLSARSAGGTMNGPGGNFVHARASDGGDSPVTFADVAGADEEKQELQEIVDFLKDPQRYIDLGARIPKGVLLVGPPGTGKTLLAKAVAGEAGVKFLTISGSDFVELYVGVGASRVRDLFQQAKAEPPAIVFIDEIDAVGRQRGAGLGGGHDEREQTLNQLLVEMDGFSANQGVIVMAATNRQDILDPALLRPGRFDRQIYVGQPDIKGREEILKVHTRAKPLAEDVDLREIARETTGFTGADLENLMNESALLAARNHQRFITLQNVQDSVIKVIAGPEKKSREQVEADRRITAFHEAGHAVVSHYLPTQDPVQQVTIIPRGQALGMTINRPERDRDHVTRQKLMETLSTLLGGRAAEETMLGYVCTGAVSDLQRATQIARNMVTQYGMSSRLGPVVYDTNHDEVFLGRSMAQARPYSEETASLIDSEVKALLDEAYQRCLEILAKNRPELEAVAAYLLEHESMDAAAFRNICGEPASRLAPEM